MADDKIYASNNAINRRFYIGNIIILLIVYLITYKVFEKYIFPYATDESYLKIAHYFSWFLYILYVITLFSLVDRRLYDICGTRDSNVYKNISNFLTTIITILIAAFINHYFAFIPIIQEQTVSMIGMAAAWIYLFIMFILSFIRGKISSGRKR